ncbi:MAG: hypothetical protein J5694_04910 [Erysipelotrichaceae bacterium]|nr:hypothetical protein [Erysipelotrichaceae bacterium]
MKKLLVVLLSVLMVLSMAACSQKAKPLADDSYALWAALGQHELADGTVNGWGDKDAALFEKSALTAIAVEDVKAIDEGVYNTLQGKEVKFLYTIDLIFGVNDAGWNTKCMKDGKLYNANGSYALKIGKCSVETDGDLKVYSVDQWISDPKTAYVEALTPETIFYPVWQEEKDEKGFSWADNPVVIGGAGLYTVVIAQYANASAAGAPGYGVALIKKQAMEGIDYEEILEYVPGDHTYGIVGEFTGWGSTEDVAMEKGEGNTWYGVATLNANSPWKVRADGAWDNSWAVAGSDNLKEVDGNLVVDADGTYKITITFDGGIKITAEKQ